MSAGLADELNGWATANQAAGLPQVILPSGNVTITECAGQIYRLVAPTKTMLMRGGAVVTLTQRDDGLLALEILRASAARSAFEKFARFMAWRAGANGEPVLKPTTIAAQMAEALLCAKEAELLLARVKGLINCPVLREQDGELVAAGPGYDEATGLLVTGGTMPPEVELDEAVPALLALLGEFEFQTEGDRARAVASLISPALKVGGFLRGRVPADVAEADQSQSGKTYRHKVMAAVYNERLALVTNRDGGVGSIDESLNQQLVAGRPFIQFDNFRGRFESAHLESFLTSEGSFPCRVPHRGEVTVPPENYFVCLTSNGVNTTADFAKRSNIIRIRKRPAGFGFHAYPEGDLLEHVRARQPYYLGCVFAVIRHWHQMGKQRSAETRHDFREWVGLVDWIATMIFNTVPVMEGHLEAQETVSNPALVWLRSVVLAVEQGGKLGDGLIASEIQELCETAEIRVPGLREDADAEAGKKYIGRVLGPLFKQGDTVDVDAFRVTREERYVTRDDASAGGGFKSKTYTVTKR